MAYGRQILHTNGAGMPHRMFLGSIELLVPPCL